MPMAVALIAKWVMLASVNIFGLGLDIAVPAHSFRKSNIYSSLRTHEAEALARIEGMLS